VGRQKKKTHAVRRTEYSKRKKKKATVRGGVGAQRGTSGRDDGGGNAYAPVLPTRGGGKGVLKNEKKRRGAACAGCRPRQGLGGLANRAGENRRESSTNSADNDCGCQAEPGPRFAGARAGSAEAKKENQPTETQGQLYWEKNLQGMAKSTVLDSGETEKYTGEYYFYSNPYQKARGCRGQQRHVGQSTKTLGTKQPSNERKLTGGGNVNVEKGGHGAKLNERRSRGANVGSRAGLPGNGIKKGECTKLAGPEKKKKKKKKQEKKGRARGGG